MIDIVSSEQFVDLMAAMLRAETLVREIGGEKKSFVAGFFDGEAEATVVTVEADEDSSLLYS